MRLEDVLECLQEPEALEVLRPHWEESLASLRPGMPSFLAPAVFLVNREYCGFGPEVNRLLEETASRIARDPALRPLAWHCFRLLYAHLDYDQMRERPSLQRALGDLGGALCLLVT